MKRIKYISQFARELSRFELDDLVKKAAAKNDALDVTGILMSSGRVFFQVLEGPDEHVDQLLASISVDERHRDVLLLDSEASITQRFFPNWGMRKVDLDDLSVQRLDPVRQMLMSVLEKRKELERLTNSLERAIWFELASSQE